MKIVSTGSMNPTKEPKKKKGKKKEPYESYFVVKQEWSLMKTTIMSFTN